MSDVFSIAIAENLILLFYCLTLLALGFGSRLNIALFWAILYINVSFSIVLIITFCQNYP